MINSKLKGNRGERTVAAKLREALPELADQIKRGWQARLGSDSCDVAGLPGFWIECKSGKRPDLRKAIEQAKRDAQGRAWPLAVVQDDYAKDRLVVLHLSAFLRIMRSAYGFLPPLKFMVQQDLFDQSTGAPEDG